MSEQTVTLRITANADGLVTGIGLAKKEAEGFGKEGARAGQRVADGMSAARRGVQSISQQLENAKKQVLGFAAAYASFNQISSLIRGVVSNTIAAEQAAAQLDAVLRSTGNAMGYTREQLQGMAQEMQRASTFGTAAITEAQTRLLSYSGIVGENFPRAMQAVIDQSARLNMSMEQSAETIGRALESPAKAAEALSRQGFGAAFTDEVKQVINGLVDAGREAEAQVMILEILEESYAGAAKAARNTLGGSLQALKEAIGDLMTVENGLPAVRQAIEGVITQISRPEVRQAFDGLFSGIIGMIPPLVRGLQEVVDFVARFADEIAATARLAAHLAPVLLAAWGASLIRQVTAFTMQLVAQAKQYVINIALAKELGVVQQQGFAASLKSIGLINAALGLVVSAFAGWQIGAWLREEFVEVERAGIALVTGLLKGWELVKASGVAAWEAIKASVLGAINVIRDAASKIIGFMATINEATDIGGFKSGITGKLREMQQQLAPATSAWQDFKAVVAGAFETMRTNQGAIDDNMFALWESAGASREVTKASTDLDGALGGVARSSADFEVALGGVAKSSTGAKDATESLRKEAEQFIAQLREQAATYGMTEEAKKRVTMGTLQLTEAQRAEAEYLIELMENWRRLEASMEPAHRALENLSRGHDDLDKTLDRNADALAGLSRHQVEYNAAMREQNRLAAEAAMLGPLTADQYAELEERMRKLGEILAQEIALDEMAEATRAASEEAQALESILRRFDDIGFGGLVRDMERVKEALAEATDPAQVERLERALAELRHGMVVGVVGTAQDGLRSLQSMASEGSDAFRAMQTAIDALTVVQAISAILNQGNGDPYTAFARMAAMAAAVSQLVGNLGSFQSSFADTAAQRQATQGTGTVLGDADAKSESIARATEITAHATQQLVGINRGMLRALQNMEAGIGSAAGMMARGAGNTVFSAMPSLQSFGALQTPIAGALGLPNILGRLLGGSAQITDQGIVLMGGLLSDMVENIMVGAYQEVQYRRWRFGNRRTREEVVDVTDALGRQFELILGSIIDTVREGALALGLLPDEIEAALASFRLEEIRISTQGLSAEEQQAELAAVFSSIFDGLAGHVAPFIEQFQRVGEGLGETLVRVATSVQVTQEAVTQLGFALDETDPERLAQISVGLVELAGGIDEFIGGMSSFMAAFAPDDHRFAVAQDALTRAFEQFGLSIPPTREAMWALMQSLDAATESGREQIAMLLRLTDTADAYYRMLEERERERARALAEYDAMRQSLHDELNDDRLSEFAREMREIDRWTAETIAGLDRAARAAGMQAASEQDLALAHQVAAQRAAAAIARLRASAAALVARIFGPAEGSLDAINARISQIESTSADAFGGVASGIERTIDSWLSGLARVRDFLDGLLLDDSLTTLTPEQRLAEAQRQYDALLQAAQGGDAEALSALPDAARQLLDLARGYWSSGDEYTAMFDAIRAQMQALASVPAPGGAPVNHDSTGSDGAALDPALSELYAERDRLLAEQEAQHRAEMLDELGGMVRELIAATGQPLAEVAASIGLNLRDMAESLGVNLNDMSHATALALVDMARRLGVDVAELAENVGVSLGNLGDRQSLLNQALEATLETIPGEFRDRLQAPLDAIRAATTEADANAAIEAMDSTLNDMPSGIRDLLAPFFEGVNPTPVVTQLTRLADINSALGTANSHLADIASAVRASNRANDVPAYASGGWVNGPSTILAGEAGRELVLPNGVSEFLVKNGIPVNTGGGAVQGELRALREEVRQLRAERLRGDAQMVAAAHAGSERVSTQIARQTLSQERIQREAQAATSRFSR